MRDFLVDFSKLNWESVYPGQRQKTFRRGDKRLRIVELTDQYPEEEWCEKEHIGYMLKGRLTIDFNGESLTFKEGDGIFITGGTENKHKGRIVKGEQVLMLLFEKV